MDFAGFETQKYDVIRDPNHISGVQEHINKYTKRQVERAIRLAHLWPYNYYVFGEHIVDWETYLVCLHRWEPDLVHPFID